MAAQVVTLGLLRIGQQASESTNYNAARNIQTMSVDDQASAFLASDQDLDRAGGLTVANAFDKVLDSTPTEAAPAVITHICTFATGEANFTIKRIALHDDTAANVTTSSNTLVAGVDGQSLTKTSDFTLAITVKLAYTNV